MSDIYCCDDCFTSIDKRSPSAAFIWLELCHLKASDGIFGVSADFSELRILEKMGFITTTETPICILVKVHGDNENFFCTGACDVTN